jgi:hypothetical protein
MDYSSKDSCHIGDLVARAMRISRSVYERVYPPSIKLSRICCCRSMIIVIKHDAYEHDGALLIVIVHG